jgi:tetratricopeptide (TPR) repeat protein
MMKEGRSWSGRERNACFLNAGGGRFASIGHVSGLDFPDDGRAIGLLDWDHDGDVDIWTSNRNAPRLRLLRNDTPAENASLAVRLEGNGRTSNRDAVGARVEVVVDGVDGRGGGAPARRLHRTVRAGEGFLAQSSRWLVFGLGEAARAKELRVRWPDGAEEVFGGLWPRRRYVVVQGSGAAVEWRRLEPAAALPPSAPALPAQSGPARIPLVTLLRLPRFEHLRFDGARAPAWPRHGRALLVNLWASWCAPCVKELKELSARHADLSAAGIDVLALAVDGLGDDRSDPAAAAALAARLALPYAVGRATPEAVQVLQQLHNQLTPTHRPLPVPASVLVDAAGHVVALYKGPVTAASAIADLGQGALSHRERFLRAGLRSGTALDGERIERSAAVAEVQTRFQFALGLQESGRLDDAIAQYLEVLRLMPEFPEAQCNLGQLHSLKGDAPAAIACLEAALRARPKFPQAIFNLGAVYDRQGTLPRALEKYRETLALDPGFPGAHNAIGVVLAKSGRIEEARGSFELATRLEPESAEAHNNLGRASLDLRRDAEALAALEKAAALDPKDAEARNNLGIALRRLGDFERAAAEYREAVRLAPGFAEAHHNLGLALERLGRFAEARAAFEAAIEAAPAFAPARASLERIKARSGS